jgi:hypothetical protein
VESLELFGGFVKFDLSSLSLSNFHLKLVSFLGNLDRQLFDLKGQLFDFGLISSSVLLESKVILFLLSGGKSPLFKLLLIPVHLKLELIHLLIGFENHVLDIVESILLISNPIIKLFNLVLQTTGLTLGDLFHVLLGFDLLVLGVDQRLGVNQFHLH